MRLPGPSRTQSQLGGIRLGGRHLALAVLVMGILLALGEPAGAQAKTLIWENFDVTITVLPNGDFHVLERQRIRFISGTFTFGFAEIPLGKTEGITDVLVSEPGGRQYAPGGFSEQPYTFDVSTSEGEEIIRWYFPPTSNAVRTFDLAYIVHGGIRVYDRGDKLQWIAIDNERDFPIEAASVTVVLPHGAEFLANPDSAGVEATWGLSADRSSVTYLAEGGMSVYDTFEIGMEFTHGVIPDVRPGWQKQHDAEEYYDLSVKPYVNLLLGVSAALLILGGPALILIIWYTRGRDPKVGPIPQYIEEPPDDLPPGVLGTLLDERADMRDVVATMINLAHKGHMTIEETGRGGFLGLGSPDFVFRKTAGHEVLGPVEKEVMRGIFTGTRTERKLSDLRNKFYTRLPKIQRRLYEQMVSRKFFRSNPDTTRKIWRGIGIALLFGAIFFGGFGSAALNEYADLLPCVFAGFGLLGLAALIAGGAMPAKTRKGAEAAARWGAFKNYLQQIDRLTDLGEAGELFEKYLPYAIAFGIRDSWIHKFSQVPATPIPGWYMPYGWIGPGPLTAGGSRGGGLARPVATGGGLQSMSDSLAGGLQSMSDGLTRLLNSTGRVMRSAPSSSGRSGGGFSGGGFSVGGGGGGGGRGFG